MIFEVNGRQAFAATGGQPVDGKRPVVLFLHGSGLDHSVWTMPARYVAHHGGSAIAVDLPAHGRSQGRPLASIEAMADWGWAALDALGISEAHLVGHSMGSLVALEMAARDPARTRGLMLIGFAPTMPVHVDLLAGAAAGKQIAAELIASWGFGQAGHLGGNRAPGLAMLPLAKRMLERALDGVLYADLKACSDYRGAEAAAQRLQCPTLLLQGELDRMTPAKAAAAFVAKLANAKSRMLEGVGHMVMAEAPAAMTAALREFIPQR